VADTIPGEGGGRQEEGSEEDETVHTLSIMDMRKLALSLCLTMQAAAESARYVLVPEKSDNEFEWDARGCSYW